MVPDRETAVTSVGHSLL